MGSAPVGIAREAPLVRWAMGTSLHPRLDALGTEGSKGFWATSAWSICAEWMDGAVLLPFRRLFILLRK